jgi:hypothetical protein
MIQQCILVCILIIIVIVLFLKNLNIEFFKNTPHKPGCPFYPPNFNNLPKNECYNADTTHIQHWDTNTKIGREIHTVDPNNPCCIRSCINDFTNVDCDVYPNLGSGVVAAPLSCSGEEGTLRYNKDNKDNNVLLDYFFTSKCYQCIKNYESAVTKLADPDAASNTTCKVT